MLSRSVAAQIQASNNPLLPFQGMSQLLESSDFNFGNLECAFSPPPGDGSTQSHVLVLAAPRETIQGLVKYNFKVLNLANNHTFDQGLDGLLFTRQYLDSNNIKHMGTGPNLAEAWQPAVVETKGIKICFVGASFSSLNDKGRVNNNYVARIQDVDNLKSAILKAKSECNFTVVTMHAGKQYTRPLSPAKLILRIAPLMTGRT